MSFMSCRSISSVFHVAKLSRCYTLLIITMHHSKTSTEAPYASVGRASVGRQHGPSKTGACKPVLNKHDSQTWPLNQPTGKHKQASFDLCLHQGNGGNHASVTKSYSCSSCPKCYVEINDPAKQDRTKGPHDQPSSKTATVLKTAILIEISLQHRGS